MYKCKWCKESFYESDIIYENGYDVIDACGTDLHVPVTKSECPYCRSEDIYEIYDEDETDDV